MTERMTMSDQIAVNAALALVLTVVPDAGRERMHLDILRLEAARMREGRPLFDPFLAAAKELVEADSGVGRRRGDWSSAMWRMKDALVRIVEWRLGEAQEVMRSSTHTREEAA
ncbi:MAG: hypothetical protein GYB53_18555 [Rhodobacteraceae bacterium]|nr:hypothetical protein [Paracoccaceae bacterium]MBR9819700.1 hypothetical protein [Paracoccaceae bacterium]